MKKIKFLFIIVFFILMAPNVVFADDGISCSDIRSKYNEYETTNDTYTNNCTNITDSSTLELCTTLEYQRNNLLQELYSYHDQNSSCDIPELEQLLQDNSGKCSNSYSSDVSDLASNVMNFFYIIAPFLLLFFGSLDFFKIIVNGDPKTISTNRSNFFKRVIAFILLYFTPVIVNLILSLSTYDLKGDNYICMMESITAIGDSSRVLYSGRYGVDNSVHYNSDTSGRLLSAANEIATFWSSERFVYFSDDNYSHNLVSYDIERSINNPSKGTCCATLVGAALYRSGLVTLDQINSTGYNGAKEIAELLDGMNWQIITSVNDLQPGDVVFMGISDSIPITLSNGVTYDESHVQIYAGGNNWYNAGGTSSIQAPQPTTQGSDYVARYFSFAMRPR